MGGVRFYSKLTASDDRTEAFSLDFELIPDFSDEEMSSGSEHPV